MEDWLSVERRQLIKRGSLKIEIINFLFFQDGYYE
jgi:hypothetical protein